MGLRTKLILLFIQIVWLRNVNGDMYQVESIQVESAVSPDTGFLEDIDFQDFFEDVGISVGSHSTPEHIHVFPPQSRHAKHRNFISSHDLDDFHAEASDINVLIHENPYQDDFFSSASEHFDSFDPYSAPHNDEFGPPKDFFSEDFSFDHGGGGQGKSSGGSGSGHGGSGSGHGGSGSGHGGSGSGHGGTGSDHGNSGSGHSGVGQESRFQDNFNRVKGKDEAKSTKKCETVQKKRMTCEVCKDDYGGFSEHCSHSLHSGKDQRYSNSKRNNNGNFKPKTQNVHKQAPAGHGSETVAAPKKTGPVYTSKHDDRRNDKPAPAQNYDHRDHGQTNRPKPPQHSSFTNPSTPTFGSFSNPHSNSYQANQFPTFTKPHNPHTNPAIQHPSYQGSSQHHPQSQYSNSNSAPTDTYQSSNFNNNQPDYHHHSFQHFQPPQPKTTHPSTHQQPSNNRYNPQPQTPQVSRQYNQPAPHKPTAYSDGNIHQQPLNLVTNQFKQPSHLTSRTNTDTYPAVPNTPPRNYPNHQAQTQQPQYPSQQPRTQPAPINTHNPRTHHTLAGPDQGYNNPGRQGDQYQASNHHQTKPKESASKDFGKNFNYDPFPDASYNPYAFEFPNPEERMKEVFSQKELPSASINNHRVVDADGSSTDQVDFTPLDPEQNFEHLGKMMKNFAKKDRSNCEKVVKKNGMTCYKCKNKHNNFDEECMYENDSKNDGVHLMYTEETNY